MYCYDVTLNNIIESYSCEDNNNLPWKENLYTKQEQEQRHGVQSELMAWNLLVGTNYSNLLKYNLEFYFHLEVRTSGGG